MFKKFSLLSGVHARVRMSFPTSAPSDIPQHLTSEDPRKTMWEVDGPFVLMFWGLQPKGDRFFQQEN